MSHSPAELAANAIFFPSGDQLGAPAQASSEFVNCIGLETATFYFVQLFLGRETRVYSSAIDIQQFKSALSDWPRHWHEEVQVVASRSGLSRHFLKESSQGVSPDDVFVVNPGEVHTTLAERDSCWQFVTAHLPTLLFSRFWEENGGRGTRPNAYLPI